MKIRKTLAIGLVMATAGVGAGSTNPAHAGSATYEILVNTTAAGLAPGAGGFVDIQLNPATAQGPPPSVSISTSGVSTDGTLGSVMLETGTAAGSLPGTVTMNNSVGTPTTNELLQGFTVHSFFDVFVTFSGSEIGPGGSGFSGTVFSLLVGDSTGNFTGATGFVNPDFPPTIDGKVGFLSGAGVTVIQVVPEPSGFVLMGLGLGGTVAVGRWRRKRIAA
jgi:hypothetical protein